MIASGDDPIAAFLRPLLFEGRILLSLDSATPIGRSDAAIAALESAFSTRCLSIAGEPIPFAPKVACDAAEIVRAACFALADHSEPAETVVRRLVMPGPPSSASDHLSADVTFRFLPQIHRRAKGLGAADPVVEALADLLRAWPLSGVLADLEEPPTTPLDFGGHRGLMALYADRLVVRDRPCWYPEGPAREHVDLARQAAARMR
jgi:hypothetical protein